MPESEHSKIGAKAIAQSQGIDARLDRCLCPVRGCHPDENPDRHARGTRLFGVTQLAAATGLGANTVTQALATLHKADVVSVRADGRYRRWTLTHSGVHRLLHQMSAPHSPLHPEHP